MTRVPEERIALSDVQYVYEAASTSHDVRKSDIILLEIGPAMRWLLEQ